MEIVDEAWRQRAWEVLAGAAPDALIAWTQDGNVLAWNEGTTRLYGYEVGEVVGRDVRAELGIHDNDVWPSASLQGPIALELDRYHKDGTSLVVLSNCDR